MIAKTKWKTVYAVVRRDWHPGHEFTPDDSSPPQNCGGEYSYTVKEIVLTADLAQREADRLNELNKDKNCRYFWEGTHYFPDGDSHGSEVECEDVD
jgi:hypothetical protein